MTNESLASLQSVGAALRHVGAAMAESFNHARAASATPLQPLDHCLAEEILNLRREGQDAIADALLALRGTYGSDGQ